MSLALRRHRSILALALIATLSACSESPRNTTASTTVSTAPTAATASQPAVEETPAELMRRANVAFRENRIVDPSGDNAAELFLAARDRDPNLPGLADALVEIMPLAQFAFEAAVQDQNLSEAERLQALIARIDEDSAITRSAETRVAELRTALDSAAAAAERAAAQAAAAKPAVTASSTKALPQQPKAAPPKVSALTETRRVAAAASNPTSPTRGTAPPQAVATPVSPVAAATPTLVAPQPISKVAPEYPPQARSRKVEGFVELEFRVATSGNAEDIRVVRSEPEGLFDRNAMRALMRWKFKPAERNGVPEAATTRTMMNFRQS